MKSIQKIINIIQEDILGTDNRFMAVAWFVCLGSLLGIGFVLNSESRSFLGVAESREQQIIFSKPIEIKHLHVITGQHVRKGELLIELDQSELNEKIQLLQASIAKLDSEKLVRHQMNLIVSNSASSQQVKNDPLSVEIEDLKKQLESLEEEKRSLFVFSQFDGIIGAVNFRVGEKVAAFNAILTLSPESPTYVEGFIYENTRTKLEVGESINVISLGVGSKTVKGKIVSVGSRIVLMPARLMNYPNAQIYGREVVVALPEKNELLIGEKVQIKPEFSFIDFPKAHASEKNSNLSQKYAAQEPKEIKVPKAIAQKFQFEPSGAIYLEDLKKFLVISDDTDKEKSAVLFLVNPDGTVDEQTMTIPGIEKVSDFESISQNGNYIYILASQGLTKKGKDKDERNVLIRFKRSALTLSATEVVDFRPLLMKALKTSEDKQIKEIFAGKDKEIDIESHYVLESDLYLGFKDPVSPKKHSVIIKIKDIESLFSKKTLDKSQITLWKTIDFNSQKADDSRLSDLVSVKGELYAATVCGNEKCGSIWKLNERDGEIKPYQIRFYKDKKPEGIAYNSKENNLFITFDMKKETALYSTIELDLKK